jgi:hypothetical protein
MKIKNFLKLFVFLFIISNIISLQKKKSKECGSCSVVNKNGKSVCKYPKGEVEVKDKKSCKSHTECSGSDKCVALKGKCKTFCKCCKFENGGCILKNKNGCESVK